MELYLRALSQRVEALHLQYVFPALATVRVGEDEPSLALEQAIAACCERSGVYLRRYILPSGVTEAELSSFVDELQHNKLLHKVVQTQASCGTPAEKLVCEAVETAERTLK